MPINGFLQSRRINQAGGVRKRQCNLATRAVCSERIDDELRDGFHRINGFGGSNNRAVLARL